MADETQKERMISATESLATAVLAELDTEYTELRDALDDAQNSPPQGGADGSVNWAEYAMYQEVAGRVFALRCSLAKFEEGMPIFGQVPDVVTEWEP